MKKNIKLNYIYNVSYQILIVLTPLVTTPYISRVLEADGVGLYSFASSIAAYFILFATLGINSYGQREISYAQEDKEQRSIIFWNTEFLCMISTCISLLVYWIYIWKQEERIIYGLISLSILAVAFDISWLLQGMEEFGKIVLRNMIIKIISIVYIFVVVHTKEDLVLYVFGMSAATLLSNISLWPYLKQYVNKPQWGKIHPFSDLKTVLSFFIPAIAVNIYTVLDKTMIGFVTQDDFENGYYEQAVKLVKTALVLVTSLGTVLMPRIGHLTQQGEKGKIQNYMYQSYRFAWFLGIPLCFGIIGIAENMVPWFFGDGYDAVVPIMQILSFLMLAIGINNVTGMQYLIPTKRQRYFTISVIIGAVINFFFNLLLIPIFKASGAAVASVMAETVIALVQLYIVRHELSCKTIMVGCVHYLVAGVLMLLVVLLEGSQLRPSIVHTVIMICSGSCVYFTVLLFMKDDFFMNCVYRVVDIVQKR